jgi:hypothetical protein
VASGWLDYADRSIEGHPEKVYRTPNRGEGIILHSVVGDLPGHSVPSRFLLDERDALGRFTPYAAASVQFIVYRDGHIRQLYPYTASTWTSGGPEANTGYWSVELEGGGPQDYAEPITLNAAFTMTRLVDSWSRITGHKPSPARIFGHKDAAARWNYAPTACPSGRYDWWLNLLFEKGVLDTMITISDLMELRPRVARLERLLCGWGGLLVTARHDNLSVLGAVLGRRPAVGEQVRLTGQQALNYLDMMENNMWLGLQTVQEEIARLKGQKEGGA